MIIYRILSLTSIEEHENDTEGSALASPAGVFRGDRISSLPLKTHAGEARSASDLNIKKISLW